MPTAVFHDGVAAALTAGAAHSGLLVGAEADGKLWVLGSVPIPAHEAGDAGFAADLAAQLSRALPGGLRPLGAYCASAGNADGAFASLAALAGGAGIVAHVDLRRGTVAAKSVQPGGALRGCETKTQRAAGKFALFSAAVDVDVCVAAGPAEALLEDALGRVPALARAQFAPGLLARGDAAVEARPAGGPVQLLRTGLAPAARDGLRVRGSLQLRAYAFANSPAAAVAAALLDDLERSLQARVDTVVDDLRAAGCSALAGAVALPYRALAAMPASGVLLSDYVSADESEADASRRFGEIYGMEGVEVSVAECAGSGASAASAGASAASAGASAGAAAEPAPPAEPAKQPGGNVPVLALLAAGAVAVVGAFFGLSGGGEE